MEGELPKERPQPASWGDAGAIRGPDGRARCPWTGVDDLYAAYHDEEWGRPERDGRALFEKLVLDGFQAGLSWLTILRKREAFRQGFDDFDPVRIARYDISRIEGLMQDEGIVRNRAKIEATVFSARAWIEIESRVGFSDYMWDFVDGSPIVNTFRRMSDVPTQTEISRRLSRDLKAQGFKFCGPTIVYAFMQAVGMVDDHLVDCWRRTERLG